MRIGILAALLAGMAMAAQCPIDDYEGTPTGKSKTTEGHLLYQYKCTKGHLFWVRADKE